MRLPSIVQFKHHHSGHCIKCKQSLEDARPGCAERHSPGLPAVLTNCSNNYGPWQYPEKLIPVVILKAAAGEPIPLYGDGLNVRDWLYVDDHVEALLLAATRGRIGASYCVGGSGEPKNRQVVEAICTLMDQLRPRALPTRA